MKKLKEDGYEYPTMLGYEREAYRWRAAFMLENNGLLPKIAQPTTIDTLKELYREEFGLDFIYIPRLLERKGIYGATSGLQGDGPQIYIDQALRDIDNPIFRKLHLSTAAHELGHAFLHPEIIKMRSAALTDMASSFMYKEVSEHQSWLVDLQKREKRKKRLTRLTPSEFREFQANQIMVGLLMPFNTLYNHAARIIKFKLDWLHHEYGWPRAYALRARANEIFDYAVNEISKCYQVSKQMASFELYRIFKDMDLSRIFLGITPATPTEKRSHMHYQYTNYELKSKASTAPSASSSPPSTPSPGKGCKNIK